ncbi:MAG: 3-oxoacyl-ACP reductase FabG [Gammaproteobacteria bacterium]|nr:3-oxoacyl-ACP reductase FabG [Gammaproteobacteria bacterium]
MSQDKEIALVTGASRGIGKAIVQALAADHRVVIGTATTESGAEKITGYMQETGVVGRGYVLNVTDQASIDALMAKIKDQYGVPTLLINNAGITRDNLIMRMKEGEWDDIINTNLTSVFRLSKACLRGMMKARTGRIISITSVVGVAGNAGQSNYAAAKAGIIGFTRSMAREVASRNITVNAVAPGFINTDMTKNLPESQKQTLLDQVPLSRLGDPEEIAATVAFLASSGAAYITGETINVNGGMYMN